MTHENGLFIFHRDLRIIDNIGLLLANSKCKNIIPIFIFTPEQVTNKNHYKSDNAIQFMLESLDSLAQEISKNGGKLHFFYGSNNTIIKQCIKDFNIDYVCFNADYSPYALKRDQDIMDICQSANITCDFSHDYYLHTPGTILNGSKEPYKKFTPYYNAALKIPVLTPSPAKKIHFTNVQSHLKPFSLKDAFDKLSKNNEFILVHGSRENALALLRNAVKTQKNYAPTRNNLTNSTSHLSASIKFGCISIREVYKVFKGNKDFIRQLIWRDFYANILYSFPYVLGKPMKPSYSKIKWHYNKKWFDAWTKGQTGYPVVDAGMREMNKTGYMHNRARLIVASFLVKTLLIDWRHGEQYFATKLTDYDPASNNGNWQWISSTGADSQPYFRIFNPWLQSAEYDSDAIYIKKWIPELEHVDAKMIHKWDQVYKEYPKIGYPKPICDYAEQKEKALALFAKVFA